MVDKIHGTSFPAEFLNRNMDFFTIRTTLDITPDTSTYDPTDVSQARLDKLIETFATRAQPIILGEVTTTSELAPIGDIPDTGAAPYSAGDTVTVYTIRLATEHPDVWTSATAVAQALNGVNGFVFSVTSSGDNNVAVYKNTYLSVDNT